MTEQDPVAAPRRPARITTVFTITAAAALLVIAEVIWFGVTGGPLPETGILNAAVAYPPGLDGPRFHAAARAGDTVYFSTATEDRQTWITAVDARTGAREWQLDQPLDVGSDNDMSYILYGESAILVEGNDPTVTEPAYLINAKTGSVHELDTSQPTDTYRITAGVPIRTSSQGAMNILNGNGKKKWGAQTEDATVLDPIAVSTPDDLDPGANPANPATADRLLTAGYDGTVTVYDKKSGKVIDEKPDAVGEGEYAELAHDDVLYTITDALETTITAYDMTDDFSKIDAWKGVEGTNYSELKPCGKKRVCAAETQPFLNDKPTNMVIELDNGIVWEAPEDIHATHATVTFAGDTMALAYRDVEGDNAAGMTQLYGGDHKKRGKPVKGWFTAVDNKTFAAIDQPTQDAKSIGSTTVSTLAAKNGKKSTVGTYPAYTGCAVFTADLACPTENGYRLWDYR